MIFFTNLSELGILGLVSIVTQLLSCLQILPNNVDLLLRAILNR